MRLIMQLPKVVYALTGIQTLTTMGFAMVLATLNLYLQSLGVSIHLATALTASFLALNFLLHCLGAMMGGLIGSVIGAYLY